jgi:hypothetical protein
MHKAEDLAKELYPDWEMTGVSYVDGQEESMVRIQRVAYIKGYHQAEEDLELTWKDIADILDVTDVIANDDSMEERLKTMSEEEYCQEVLKRFKAQKGGEVWKTK